jgi:hypothetical protein
MAREALLSRTLVELTGQLVDDFDVIDVLTLLSERCVEVLGVSAAGFLLAAPEGDLRAIASSTQALEVVEIVELQAEAGPCMDCYRTNAPVVNARLADGDHHGSPFASLARECGFRSVHVFPMRLRDFTIGTLSLLRSDDRLMDEVDVRDAQALADVGTIAVLHRRASLQGPVLNEQLEFAINSRITVAQAKGVVAERLDLDLEQGFVQLRRYAHDHRRRLVDVARDVIDGNLVSGDLGQP